MPTQQIQVRKLSPTLGAEIHGVDLAKPLSDENVQNIHDALMQHQVIFFRDQEISIEQHKTFGRLFGELAIHPASKGPEGHPELLIVHADEKSNYVAGHGWHSDVTADLEPPMGSILHLGKVPEYGGDTLFASMYAAYDALSDRLKNFLADMIAVHTSEQIYHGRYGLASESRDSEFPSAEHPIIRTHPVTRKKLLFVNETFTSHIKGLTRKESDGILLFLFEHITTVEFQYRFQWRDNSIAFWDNRCVQHHSVWDYYPAVRSGYRVAIKGDRPF